MRTLGRGKQDKPGGVIMNLVRAASEKHGGEAGLHGEGRSRPLGKGIGCERAETGPSGGGG